MKTPYLTPITSIEMLNGCIMVLKSISCTDSHVSGGGDAPIRICTITSPGVYE